MNEQQLRRRLAAAIRAAESAMAKAEHDGRSMTRDTQRGKVLALREVETWLSET